MKVLNEGTAGAFVTKMPLQNMLKGIMANLAGMNARDLVEHPVQVTPPSGSGDVLTDTYDSDPDAQLYNLDVMSGPKTAIKTSKSGLESILRTPDQATSVMVKLAERYDSYQAELTHKLRTPNPGSMTKDRSTSMTPSKTVAKPDQKPVNTESYITGASGPEDRTGSRHDLHNSRHGHKDSYSATKGKSDPLLDDVMKKSNK